MSKGIVYIMTNPSLAGWVKVGKTERPTQTAQERANDLSRSTSIPLNFRVYAEFHVENCEQVEEGIHSILENANPAIRAIDSTPAGRERKKEFFLMQPEQALAVFKNIARLMRVPTEDLKKICQSEAVEQELEEIVEKAVDEQRTRRGVMSFTELDIPINAVLIFTRDESITCTVIGEREVEYEGEPYKISALAERLIGYHDTGMKYFMYEGETLWNRRIRLESEAFECKV
ncbi:MAG: GIY-YIG nuclease family protein [Rickettsiales bacterium]|jgi:hypothetical protein|nr:GIY-YIG nuclease family protein [Rickettsiales bacterium]